MLVDIIGTENVLKYIKASKYSKFVVLRAGTTAAGVNVYESTDTEDNESAIQRFEDWANVVNNNVPYKILLFNEVEITTTQDGEIKTTRKKSKAGKMEALFILNNTAVNFGTSNQSKGENLDVNQLTAQIVEKIQKEQNENLLLKKITELEAKINAYEEDEEDEEEESGNSIAGIDANQLQQIMGLVNLFKGTGTPPQINGEIEDRNANIKNAINRLYKHDKDIDKHLLKLADISEKDPATFKMLIGMLEQMN